MYKSSSMESFRPDSRTKSTKMLEQCSECQSKMSSHAKTCPSCGCPRPLPPTSPSVWGGLISACMAFWMLTNWFPPTDAETIFTFSILIGFTAAYAYYEYAGGPSNPYFIPVAILGLLIMSFGFGFHFGNALDTSTPRGAQILMQNTNLCHPLGTSVSVAIVWLLSTAPLVLPIEAVRRIVEWRDDRKQSRELRDLINK